MILKFLPSIWSICSKNVLLVMDLLLFMDKMSTFFAINDCKPCLCVSWVLSCLQIISDNQHDSCQPPPKHVKVRMWCYIKTIKISTCDKTTSPPNNIHPACYLGQHLRQSLLHTSYLPKVTGS